ncbi:MAG: DUF362 domain-containing protein [bacterium]|nr:DUF362 domain-containing protein [bacterium]
MPRQTRRTFLGGLAAAGGAVTLGSVGSLAQTDVADMSITRLSADKIEGVDLAAIADELTRKSIASLGGMQRFVKKGDEVWLKPNIGWNRAPELAANTNPDVVATLVGLCLEAGAKRVRVGDNPCHSARQTYRRSGIAKAVEAAGGEVVYLDEKRFKEYKLNGDRLDAWPLYKEIVDSDVLINVPVLKHHGLSKVSMAMKNLMGVISGQRSAWHQDLDLCLCDITNFLKPHLNVLDAVRALTANGPQGGNPSDVITPCVVAAGVDIVALDAFGAELMGHDPTTIKSVARGHAAGLGEIDYRKLTLKEMSI